MHTYCAKMYSWLNDCAPWQPRGDYIDSGDNTNRPYSKNNLEYYVEISTLAVNKSLASVTFDYMVDAEKYFDFFIFSIDYNVLLRSGMYFFKVIVCEISF